MPTIPSNRSDAGSWSLWRPGEVAHGLRGPVGLRSLTVPQPPEGDPDPLRRVTCTLWSIQRSLAYWGPTLRERHLRHTLPSRVRAMAVVVRLYVAPITTRSLRRARAQSPRVAPVNPIEGNREDPARPLGSAVSAAGISLYPSAPGRVHLDEEVVKRPAPHIPVRGAESLLPAPAAFQS